MLTNGDPDDPYGAVLEATPAHVQLVLIDGVPLYGNREFIERLWARPDLEEMSLPGGRKTLATPAAGVVIAQVAARLQAALTQEGTSLAPLTETDVSSP